MIYFVLPLHHFDHLLKVHNGVSYTNFVTFRMHFQFKVCWHGELSKQKLPGWTWWPTRNINMELKRKKSTSMPETCDICLNLILAVNLSIMCWVGVKKSLFKPVSSPSKVAYIVLWTLICVWYLWLLADLPQQHEHYTWKEICSGYSSVRRTREVTAGFSYLNQFLLVRLGARTAATSTTGKSPRGSRRDDTPALLVRYTLLALCSTEHTVCLTFK